MIGARVVYDTDGHLTAGVITAVSLSYPWVITIEVHLPVNATATATATATPTATPTATATLL